MGDISMAVSRYSWGAYDFIEKTVLYEDFFDVVVERQKTPFTLEISKTFTP